MKGIAKFVSRAKTSLLQSTGSIEKTVDRDFDELVAKLRAAEPVVTRLRYDIRTASDALQNAAAGMVACTGAIEVLVPTNHQCANAAAATRSAAESVNAEVRPALDAVLRAAVVETFDRYYSLFAPHNEAISRRKNKLLDYDSARDRHRRQAEKPETAADAQALAAAETELNEKQAQYAAVHTPLLTSIPAVIGMRNTYLRPATDALLRVLYGFAAGNIERLGGTVAVLASGAELDSVAACDAVIARAEQQIAAALVRVRDDVNAACASGSPGQQLTH